jgi:hypothetical protein
MLHKFLAIIFVATLALGVAPVSGMAQSPGSAMLLYELPRLNDRVNSDDLLDVEVNIAFTYFGTMPGGFTGRIGNRPTTSSLRDLFRTAGGTGEQQVIRAWVTTANDPRLFAFVFQSVPRSKVRSLEQISQR